MLANEPNQSKIFYCRLSELEWELLAVAAKKNGKKNIRRFITARMFSLEKKMRDLDIDCSKEPKRIKNVYHIPAELQPFFQKLMCHYGRPVSEIMTRLIISPTISDELDAKQDQNKMD